MWIFRLIFLTLIPAVLLYLSSDIAPWGWYQRTFGTIEPDDLQFWKFVFFGVGALLTFVVLPIQNHKLETRANYLSNHCSQLLELVKTARFKDLYSRLGVHLDLKTRYFVPNRNILARMWAWCTGSIKKLVVKQIQGVTDNLFPVLSFGTTPPEGLVGHTFKTGNGIIEGNLDDSSPYTTSLSDKKRVLLQKVKFCATMPIKSDRRQGKVLGVLAVDGEQELTMNPTQHKAFSTFMVNYAAFVDTYKHN